LNILFLLLKGSLACENHTTRAELTTSPPRDYSCVIPEPDDDTDTLDVWVLHERNAIAPSASDVLEGFAIQQMKQVHSRDPLDP